MSTATATSLLIFAEVWTPEGEGQWQIDGSAYTDDAWKPESSLAGGDDDAHVIADCVRRRGPIVGEDMFFGERPGGTVPMLAALPIYDRDKVSSIVVLAFQTSEEFHGAVEVWSGSVGDFELHHENGVYPHMDRFERISKYVHFPWASGLPGRAWEYAAPQMLTGIGESLAFLRSSGASEAGLDIGLSVPVIDSKHLRGVMVFLSGGVVPMFRAYEIWRPIDNRLKRVDSYGNAVAFLIAGKRQQLPPGDGLAGRAWARKAAVIDADLSEGVDQRKDAAGSDALSASIAIPVVIGDEVRGILQLSF
jgi:hypothetical protein